MARHESHKRLGLLEDKFASAYYIPSLVLMQVDIKDEFRLSLSSPSIMREKLKVVHIHYNSDTATFQDQRDNAIMEASVP